MDKVIKYCIVFIFAIGLFSCSATKHLPEGKTLYTGVNGVKLQKVKEEEHPDWKIVQGGRKKIRTLLTLNATPNGDMFGMPFLRFFPIRLYMWNFFYTEKEKGFSKWMMKNFGEKPVTIENVAPQLRVLKIENDYFNEGHFGTTASYKIHPHKRKPKAKISYEINITRAYTYRDFELTLDSSQTKLASLYKDYINTSSLLKKGDDFSMKTLEQEKFEIWKHFHNHGYYYIKRSQILILADTTVGDKQIDIRYALREDDSQYNLGQLFVEHKVAIIDTVVSNPENIDEEVVSNAYVKLRPHFLNKVIEVDEDSLYSYSKTTQSIKNLNSLGIFSQAIIDYKIDTEDSLKSTAITSLKMRNAFSIGLNTDINYKNSGFIGPALGVRARQLNLFGGAENLTLEANGYYDFPIGLYNERISDAFGYNFIATINAPLLSPFVFRKLPKKDFSIPRRFIRFSFEKNNRIDYFQLVNWKTSFGWYWQDNSKVSHQLNFINVEYTRLTKTTPEFEEILANNQQVFYSFQNQVIVGPSYRFIYNNKSVETKKVGVFYEGEISTAGNLFDGINSVFAGGNIEQGRIFNIPYSHFVKLTSDFRTYLAVGQSGSQLVFRNILGIGRAYGNSNTLPYNKQFYIGGTNSLRPITARSVGPGRYLEFDETAIDQVGDLKMEMNLELRLRLGVTLFAALWTDFGNIWLFEEDPDRPFSGIRWNHIFEDCYMTNGAGLYIDLKFFVFRVDYGFLTYAPIFIDGYKWIWQNKLPLHGPLISIGYPF